jgi:hypothetical protein
MAKGKAARKNATVLYADREARFYDNADGFAWRVRVLDETGARYDRVVPGTLEIPPPLQSPSTPRGANAPC